MKPRWLFVVCCVSIFALQAHAAAVPTQETFVVAKSEEESSETLDVTTSEPNSPIKLTEMRVKSEVSLRYAHTAVITRVRNPARRAQQTTFHVLLPETAFISGFVMTLSGKTYKAYVKEKEEAKKIYTDAVSHGTAAAHISARARDSNHFTVSVNVEPKSEAVFNLTYEELLVRRNGVYNHDINLHPGAVVPKMEVTVHIKESQKISVLRVPEVRTGNEIDATENDVQYSKPLLLKMEKSNDEKEATISFTPDREEQIRLMRIYADKTKESAFSQNNWYMNQGEDESSTGVLGQFVVQYDVDRPENGEILVNDGYFVHFFAPPALKPLSKHVVFVLDTSGSMSGRKIEQLREAMRAILDDLHSTDLFNIVEFNTNVKVHKVIEPEEESESPYAWGYKDEPVTLAPPSIATSENIEKAKTAVSRLSARGGTNIYKALDVAVDVINKIYETDKKDSTNVTLKAEEKEKKDEFQPIIIFLTDGDATVGETSQARIISYISEKNSADRKAAIYSLAFGQDADRDLLRKLSVRNEGFMRHIYEAADAELQLRDFYRQVSSPLLSDAHFVYPPEQVKEGSMTRRKFRTVFMGSELVVAGEVEAGVSTLEPQLNAFCADDSHRGLKRYEIKNKVEVPKQKNYLPLERLWAYLTIKQLLDERDAKEHTDKKDPNSPEKRALDIALKYEFVTPLTSLVVVKPNATDAVDAESVDKTSYALPHRPNFASYTGTSLIASHNRGGPSSFGIQTTPFPPIYQILSNVQAQSLALDEVAGFELEEEDQFSDVDVVDYPGLPGVPGRPGMPGMPGLPGLTAAFGFPGHLPLPAPTRRPAIELSVNKVTTADSASDEKTYHLESYNWALSLLNSNTNSLEFLANGKNVTLELSKSSIPPKDITDSECTHVSVANGTHEAGVCVYLTRCAAARSIAPDLYIDTYCVVQNKFAGVCCPKDKVDSETS